LDAELDWASSKLNNEYSRVGEVSSERKTLDRAKSGKPGAKVGSTKNLNESVRGEIKNSLAKCIMTQPLEIVGEKSTIYIFTWHTNRRHPFGRGTEAL
jgi:hypothetical protein